MSEQAPENPPEPQEGAQQSEQNPKAESEGKPAVEFDGPFDEQRAKKLIANLRSDLDKKTKREQDLDAKVKKFEDEKKTSEERLSEDLVKAEQKSTHLERDLMRRDVAEDKGVPKRLLKFLTGDTREEIEVAADELMDGVGQARPPAPNLKQGVRSGGAPGQLAREDLASMKPAEIEKARREGRLDRVMGKSA